MQLASEPWYGTSRYVWRGPGVQALLPTAAKVPSWQERQFCANPREIVPFPHAVQTRAPNALA